MYFAAQILSMSAFVIYGLSCMFSKRMVLEFDRYGLSKFRFLTGLLQFLAAVALFIGFFLPYLTTVASFGLALQMILGVGLRLKIKDSFLQTFPAIFFCILNVFICYLSLLAPRFGPQ